MNQAADEALIAQIKQLPPERRAEVEDFVRFLFACERRRKAGDALKEMWDAQDQEDLTPEIEQMIVDEVRAVRVENRAKREQAARANRS